MHVFWTIATMHFYRCYTAARLHAYYILYTYVFVCIKSSAIVLLLADTVQTTDLLDNSSFPPCDTAFAIAYLHDGGNRLVVVVFVVIREPALTFLTTQHLNAGALLLMGWHQSAPTTKCLRAQSC